MDTSSTAIPSSSAGRLAHDAKQPRTSARSIYHHHGSYKVVHQYVSIDVDLTSHRIDGVTELTIAPTSPLLKYLYLDCRSIKIKNVYLNNKKISYIHNDIIKSHDQSFLKSFIDNDNYHPSSNIYQSINQHHYLKANYDPYFSGQNTKELYIQLPDNFKITLQDTNQTPIPLSMTNASINSPYSIRTPSNDSLIYTPLTIKIEYSLQNPIDGVNFVGGYGFLNSKKIKKYDWHAYTTNSNLGLSTSYWLPCLDSLWEKSTWQIDITVPKTIANITAPIPLVASSLNFDDNEDDIDIDIEKTVIDIDDDPILLSNSDSENEYDNNIDENYESINEREIKVICCDLTSLKETPHPLNENKKIVSFQIATPISAHHLGWAIGPFKSFKMIDLKDKNQNAYYDYDYEKDTFQIESLIYCLPSKINAAKSTTIFLAHAIEFFSREFGSFPFSSYSIVFVDDLTTNDSNSFAGLNIHSNRILYEPNAIEPLYSSTEIILDGLTLQWSGVNVVPADYKDFWVTIGIANYMSLQYYKKLMGWNEFKFKIKKATEQICKQDINKNPLADPFFLFPINENDDKTLKFIRLKSPIVIYILDRRMTKTDKSFGLSRVIPKIFLQAMSGDLPNGGLSTTHFQYICEKVNHNKLDDFFNQWIYGSGTPTFEITQRFNKKRMFIEMGIRQTQNNSHDDQQIKAKEFIDESIFHLTKKNSDEINKKPNTVFTGPMTIRIHEADGTPYEHIVNIKDSFSKIDIQYNTKYKRLKKVNPSIHRSPDGDNEEMADLNYYDSLNNNSLGNILKSEQEMRSWNLYDFSKEKLDKKQNEAFEWIRIDADFEWICCIHVNQPDYMFCSQLQSDRDVEAQLDAIQYFKNSPPNKVYSSILTRTLMDSRYYYGIRLEAANALAALAKEECQFIGMKHLIKAFQILFCYENSSVPVNNDFSNFPNYFLQKGIPVALSKIRNIDGRCPNEIKIFILNLIKFNDNQGNYFLDHNYMGDLIKSLMWTIDEPNNIIDENNVDESEKLIKMIVEEVEKLQHMDESIPSFENHILYSILKQQMKLIKRNLIHFSFEETFNYTSPRYNYNIRIMAFELLLYCGGIKNSLVLHYLFFSIYIENSRYFKYELLKLFYNAIGFTSMNQILSQLEDEEFEIFTLSNQPSSEIKKPSNDFSMIVVEEKPKPNLLENSDFSIEGLIKYLRKTLATGNGIKKELYSAIHSNIFSIKDKRRLFDICEILFEPVDSVVVKLGIPSDKRIVARVVKDFEVVLKREIRAKKPEVTKSSIISIKPQKLKLKNKKGNMNLGIIKLGTGQKKRIKSNDIKGISEEKPIAIESSPIKKPGGGSKPTSRRPSINKAVQPLKPKLQFKTPDTKTAVIKKPLKKKSNVVVRKTDNSFAVKLRLPQKKLQQINMKNGNGFHVYYDRKLGQPNFIRTVRISFKKKSILLSSQPVDG
ncbi:transcription initiation factor TFIID subunit TAF2 ASCRUDRAFT_31537 [Ascoidea rubescens DSM 1968]|uniref:Transcription initiation factor TFIID subunit 2 n=1 Tax=Ascoidea rubescens DSM 1968 TaxID=1344418 RepID=A0A1D2VMX2_9ASCO|nr:hypothetical protein ASCRUDRAFT_31537 [Ascoidea rubescens DSM 1968]ODV62956.1 hypothetical protein ASCRUDRAFT_31537 [Ascoidea rubescens DSM 1968]